jgi:hypothetical protein
MKIALSQLIYSNTFVPISLDELNQTSELLNREERKYAVSQSRISEIILALSKRYRVLEHVEKRVFSYESVYFDDALFTTYFDHFKGRRKRFKIRSRFYQDSNLCTFEMKIKRYRGCTDKRRINYPVKFRSIITPQAYTFLDEFYYEKFHQDFHFKLLPILTVSNQRVTFVSNAGGERLTIDFDMVFRTDYHEYTVSEDFVIIETKTSNGYGHCDRILAQHGARPQKWCSKYCLGAASMKLVLKNTTFLPVLKIIDKYGGGEVHSIKNTFAF